MHFKVTEIIAIQDITVHYSTTKGRITLYVTHWKVALHKVSVVFQDKFHFAIAKSANLKSNPPSIFTKRIIHYLPLRKRSKKHNSTRWTCYRLIYNRIQVKENSTKFNSRFPFICKLFRQSKLKIKILMGSNYCFNLNFDVILINNTICNYTEILKFLIYNFLNS